MNELRISVGKPEDFEEINQLTAAAIYPAFDHPDLTDEQRAETDYIVSIARKSCLKALESSNRTVFVAYLGVELAGFVIADKAAVPCPEIDWLIVFPEFHGSGVAQKLMEAALDWFGPNTEVQLNVIHYNARAIAFYKKYGFEDTGKMAENRKIPRKILVRPANR